MNIERRILVEFKARTSNYEGMFCADDVFRMLDEVEKDIVGGDVKADLDMKKDAMTGLLRSPELLGKILES